MRSRTEKDTESVLVASLIRVFAKILNNCSKFYGRKKMYPNMQIKTLMVNGKEVQTCSEGYIVDLDQWSENFVIALAAHEGLELTKEHWEIIHYIRDYHEKNNVQPNVRTMIKHFSNEWDAERGSNRYLHDIFPKGGPQKQGNRLAGIRRTKGEH